MSLAPNPDLFASASVNIDRVSQPQMQLQRSVMPAPAPIMQAPALTPAYGQLQQSIFPTLQQQQLQATQQAAQATTAPANAYSAVEKALKADPWTKPSATTMPQSNFINPAPNKPSSGWVPNGLPQI